LVSDRGHRPITYAFHDRVTLPPGVVRDVPVNQVGMSEAAALELVKGRRR
jgi:hypothetical protein